MSAPTSPDRLRHGALAMLADGNRIEAVAHVLGVPADAVLAWQADGVRAPEPAPARDAPGRLRFDDALSHGASPAVRLTLLAIVTAFTGVMTIFFLNDLRSGGWGPNAWLGISAGVGIVLAYLRGTTLWTRRTLVLGREMATAPDGLWWKSMPYAEIAGYTLDASSLGLPGGHTVRGRRLTLHSRRPGSTLAAFLFDDHPVDDRLFDRLDEVVRANRGKPALPAIEAPEPAAPSAQEQASEVKWRFAGVIVVMVVALAPVLSIVDVGVQALAHPTPPLVALQHAEGAVTSVSDCVAGSRGRRMVVEFFGRAGPGRATIPCIVSRDALLRGGQHRVAADIDPGGSPPNLVYQFSLDGRLLLAYRDVVRRERPIAPTQAWVAILMPLALVAFLTAIVISSWRKLQAGALGD